MTNPFKVLGFAPSAIQGLSNKQISELIKAQYRVLSKIHHPDMNGKASVFRRINEAAQKLDFTDNPEEFCYWKEQFLKPRKDQIADLEAKLKALFFRKRETEKKLISFWMAFAGEQPQSGFSAFQLSSVRFLITDVIEHAIYIKSMSQPQHLDPRTRTIKQELFKRGPKSFDLEVDENSSLKKFEVRRKSFDPEEGYPDPNIPKEWLGISSLKGQSYFWKRTGNEKELPGIKIIGSISPHDLRKNSQALNKFAPLLQGDAFHKHYKQAKEGFPASVFRPYLSFISPIIDLRNNTMLIGARIEKGEIFFVILGQARQAVRL